jgi:hypothetical protein
MSCSHLILTWTCPIHLDDPESDSADGNFGTDPNADPGTDSGTDSVSATGSGTDSDSGIDFGVDSGSGIVDLESDLQFVVVPRKEGWSFELSLLPHFESLKKFNFFCLPETTISSSVDRKKKCLRKSISQKTPENV